MQKADARSRLRYENATIFGVEKGKKGRPSFAEISAIAEEGFNCGLLLAMKYAVLTVAWTKTRTS